MSGFSILRLPALLLMLSALGIADKNGYLGSEVCAGCHQDIAKTQAETNMAKTWQGLATTQLPVHYAEKHEEGPAPAIQYRVERSGSAPQFQVELPGQSALEFPVESMIGGKRHAISFLFRVPNLEGSALPRSPLVEGRYIHSVLEHGLSLELGFPEDKPTNLEVGMGRVLTPNLEKRCFSCHVAPRTWGTRVETGVACENCHGPGQKHLVALGVHAADSGILNPAKLPVADRMKPCSQCHAGSGFVEDPMADQLLISDQVTALKNSECWRQTAGQITCTNCHNPHQDATREVLTARSEKTCLSCHSAAASNRAGLCPVNRATGCVGCHMPNQIHGAFHLANHWIQVHPEQGVKAAAVNPDWQTTVLPKHVYLRQLVLDDATKAINLRQEIAAGGSFFELARANSVDRDTGKNGGYMGDLTAGQLDPTWSGAVLKLQPGELSQVVQSGGKCILFQRMPRNFREDAEAQVNRAIELRKTGKPQESNTALFDALKIYPHFLRALTYLGISYSQSGNPQVGAGVLSIAARLYPKDQGAHFNLGVAYGALGNPDEISEYQKTLEIDADYIPAYLNWGGSLYAKGRYDGAIQLYRKALLINPLNADLHYSLSVALDQTNQKQEAEAELTLAAKIDRKYTAH